MNNFEKIKTAIEKLLEAEAATTVARMRLKEAEGALKCAESAEDVAKVEVSRQRLSRQGRGAWWSNLQATVLWCPAHRRVGWGGALTNRTIYLPSPKQIDLETAAIRKTWSRAVKRKRMGVEEELTVTRSSVVNDGRVIRKGYER
jgi:hypothetical protein